LVLVVVLVFVYGLISNGYDATATIGLVTAAGLAAAKIQRALTRFRTVAAVDL
jgi:hypothetical protein